MKFEIRDPGSSDDSARPWSTAIEEQLFAKAMEFVPLAEGCDGTPHQEDDGTVHMMMIGGYESVLKLQKTWTIEIATIEDLMEQFKGYDISIVRSEIPECTGLIEFEEPPSYSLSYS